MFKAIRNLMYVSAVCLMVMLLVSCGGSSDTATTGTLGVGLTDATTDQYKAIYVTIAEVQVQEVLPEGEEVIEDEEPWPAVLTPGQTFNLLDLVNGVIADLGLTELEAGQYRMRLLLGELPEPVETNILGEEHPFANYLIKTEDDSIEELTVPSGYQSGIKIVHDFTIVAGGATEIILDFDALKSVVQAGNSGQWLLKPTIKVLETVNNSVSGVVNIAGDSPVPAEGALVSAQIDDSLAVDAKDGVITQGGTLTIGGAYSIFLPPNTYNIVATMSGYAPQCQLVAATGYLDYIANFTLGAAETGTFIGSVNGLATEESALFSIRQFVDCDGDTVADSWIEVASFNVAEGAASDPVILPAGAYEVVVSAEGKTTQVFDVVVAVDPPAPALPTPVELDVVFPPTL